MSLLTDKNASLGRRWHSECGKELNNVGLGRQELLSLFNDNVALSPDEMRTELSRLITEAKKIQKEFEKEMTYE